MPTASNLTAAGGAFRRMEAVVQRQAERAPDNVEWQRDLALAKSFVADVLYDQGELDGALAKYLEAQGILQALVQKDADNVHWVEWVRDLAISLNRVGDIGRTRGNYEGALKAYRLALSLTEQLVDISPHEVLLRYDMAICYNKIGYAEWLANDLAAARDAFDVALQIDQGLLAKDPDNVDYLRHETVNLNWIGDIGRLTGKPADALAAYEKSRAITEKLMARDPQNTVYRRDLAINFGKIGDARLALGDLDGAARRWRSPNISPGSTRPTRTGSATSRSATTGSATSCLPKAMPQERRPNTRPGWSPRRRCSTPARPTPSACSTWPTATTSWQWPASTGWRT
jgi:tetratricopeptide (TPR) repeat protein